jgi:hypothetical protein
MQMPIVHFNGSSPERLAAQYEAARDAVYVALDAMREAAPNARDYYPIGDDAFARAAVEHVRRLQALEVMLKEMDQLLCRVLEAK